MNILVLWTSCFLVGLAHGAPKKYICGRTIVGQGFVISTDYLPPTANGESCSWTLQALPNQHVAVSFDNFDIGHTASMLVYNGVDQTTPNLLTSYFSTGPAGTTVTFGSNKVTLVFKNGFITQTSRAFAFSFASITPPDKSNPGLPFTDCGENLVGGGRFTSPGNPGWYPNDAQCTWTLKAAPKGLAIKIFFDFFDVESNADYVTIYDGPTTDATVLKKLTGSLVSFIYETGTTVTIQFTSDPSIARSGFSARFTTVLPVIPPDVAAACSASCPKTITPDPNAYCYAHDDPHMRTFDGRTYELQKEGIFYLYRHDNAPIWVQAVFQQCPAPWTAATCSCAVAVRYWNEVFVVDRCLPAGGQTRPNRVYKSGNSSMMAISKDGIKYIVRLPNGLSVDINAVTVWIGTVDLRAAVGDKNVVQGVCGLYNSNPNDDATFRQGYDPQKVTDAWLSWRVPDAETLFAPTLPPYPERIGSCDCDNVKKDNPLPPGVLWVNLQPVPNTELSDSSKINFTNDPNPGVITFPNKPWPDNWTPDKATAFCNNYVSQRPAITLCKQVAGDALDISPIIQNCVRDIYLTGTTDFALTALEGSKTRCADAIRDKPEDVKKQILDQLCPKECSGQGTCVKGVCQCQAGLYGADCSVNLSTPPVLRTSSPVQTCLAARLVNGICYQENVFGETFYNVIMGTPICLVTAKKTTAKPEGLITEDLPIIRAAAALVSPSTVPCPLQMVLGPFDTPYSVSYTISVSNDNAKFSNTIQTTRSFVPPCGSKVSASGTLTSPLYPGRYYAGANCTWELTASAGMNVQLVFNAFSITQKSDTLQIVDSGLTVDRFSTTEALGKTLSYGPKVSVVFTSGKGVPSTGFSIAFTSIPSPTKASCGGQLTGSGDILSPGSPGNYPDNAYCLWSLTADAGKIVNLHFDAFSLEEKYDNLDIYFRGQRVTSFTGSNIPADFTIPSPAYLVFRSDSSTNFSGFNIKFTSI